MNYRKTLAISSTALMIIIAFAAIAVNLGVEPKNNPPNDILPINNTSPSPSITNKPSPTPTQTGEPQRTPSPTSSLTPTSTATSPNNPNIKVYNDISYELTDIDWGTINIAIGDFKIYTINVLNNGNRPVLLGLSTTNWTPGVRGTVTWNYDGKAIAVNAAVPITLTLTIQTANVSAFSNSIIVTCTSA